MKHPVLQNRTRLIIWWMAWFFLASGQIILLYFAHGSFEIISIPDTLLSLFILSVLVLSLWYPFNYVSRDFGKIHVLIFNLILTGAIAIALSVFITRSVIQFVVPEKTLYDEFWRNTIPYRTGISVFIYILAVLTYYLFINLSNLSEKKAREAKLESLVKETELKMLRSQINPHFLFNSLNSVSSLTLTRPEKAREMVIKLSEFMRYALSKKDEQEVSLKNELENLGLYFDIEKIRFGDKLLTEENIDPRCLELKLPVMILQPLYENAIKHGVYESTGTVTIKTEIKKSEGYMLISISNNYDPSPSSGKGTGTGLINVEKRLALFYGEKALIKTSAENNVFKVTLFIPTET